MLIREAKWFGDRIRELGDPVLFPMLNVGSQTEEFRRRGQPWIDRYIFGPIRDRGQPVVHIDLRSGDGVDMVGDLTDPKFLAEIARRRFHSAFCNNLMEHVPNLEEIGRAVAAAVVPGGYLLVSVPNVFPYHPDPIDTMYRPNVQEFAALFPGTTLIRGDRLRCGTLATYMFGRFAADPRALARMLFQRRGQSVAATSEGMSAWQWLPWLWRSFYQTCLVLRRDSPAERGSG